MKKRFSKFDFKFNLYRYNKGGKSYSRGIRIEMEQALRGVPNVVFTEETPRCSRDCYRRELRRSQFCLCPRGWSPWTLRAYQAGNVTGERKGKGAKGFFFFISRCVSNRCCISDLVTSPPRPIRHFVHLGCELS